MQISYNRLWKLLIDRKIKKMKFREMTRIGTSTLARLGNDEAVTMEVLMRICDALNCKIEDIVEFVPDENEG